MKGEREVRRGIKNYRSRARLREILYSLAIDAAWLIIGTVPVWLPIVMIIVAGGLIDVLGL